ncbi:MAG: APC family permease, partial [Bryobacteraceae bacterium]|nr:APC family permease [Bryobacteraceae bacterium]
AARAGPASLSLWVLAAALFFVPSALAVSRLSSRWPEQGGLYVWARRSFGDWHGFLCGWCYWLSNVFYFPNLLLAGLGMAAYLFGERGVALSENRTYLLTGALVLLWAGALTNLAGLRIGKWTENLGGLATCAAGSLLLASGFAVWLRGKAAPIAGPWWPRWDWGTVNFWSQIAFAFGGLELAAAMAGEIRDPARTVPRAAWLSGAAIAAFYLAGTVAMLILIPPGGASIITGLAQAGAAASQVLGAAWLGRLLAALVTLGVAGQLGAWLAGSARIPFAIGLDRYLPPAFARLHPRWGTPHVAILAQALACTVFLIAMQAGESPRAGYQSLVDMTVITYFIPFLYMFLAAARQGLRASAACGLAVTSLSIVVSLAPPAEAERPLLFTAKIVGGCSLVLATARMVFARTRRA